jgi:hypothetical protein
MAILQQQKRFHYMILKNIGTVNSNGSDSALREPGAFAIIVFSGAVGRRLHYQLRYGSSETHCGIQ